VRKREWRRERDEIDGCEREEVGTIRERRDSNLRKYEMNAQYQQQR
jgi:hypothetical protein